MTKYKSECPQLQSLKEGGWRGKPKSHLLLTEDKMKNIIDVQDGFYSEIESIIDSDKMSLHSYFYSMVSSQAMLLNLFGPLRAKNRVDILNKVLNMNIQTLDNSKFEKRNNDSSEYDYYIEDGNNKIYFEAKYSEADFKSKSKASDDNSRWNSLYKKDMNSILSDTTRSKELFFYQYQLWRNIVQVAKNNQYSVFVVLNRRTDLIQSIKEAIDLLKMEYKDKVIILSIDKLCEECIKDSVLSPHYQEFKKKYLGTVQKIV